MVSQWLVLLFGVALCCGAPNEDLDLSVVLQNVNGVLSEAELQWVKCPNVTISLPMFSASISNVQQGRLDTVYPISGRQQAINKTAGGHSFAIHVGLKDFQVSYDYEYSLLGLLHGSGRVKVEVPSNEASLTGSVSRIQDQCKAQLDSATIDRLTGFTATVEPASIIHFILAKFIDLIHNFISTSDVPNFNKIIASSINTSQFQDLFASVVCRSLP